MQRDLDENTWAGVRERVLRLAGHSGRMSVFGARGHEFRLGPVMREDRVRALEAALGTGLPAAYRGFLRQVGAGGAGPDYGLLTPVEADGDWQWRAEGLAYSGLPVRAEYAGRPFLAESRQHELDALEEAEPERAAFADPEEFRRAYADWDRRYETLYTAQTEGAVFLSEQGCGYSSLLVMTGPHRGTIWHDARPADRGVVPAGTGFAEWYHAWLTGTERRLGRA
jgi:hypothetical protein